MPIDAKQIEESPFSEVGRQVLYDYSSLIVNEVILLDCSSLHERLTYYFSSLEVVALESNDLVSKLLV